MSLARRIAPFAAAAIVAALLLGIGGLAPRNAHAQSPPALYYGAFTPGDVVEAFINDVSCGTTTAASDGEWKIEIPATAPCSPSAGSIVTFTRNGVALKATEEWSQGAIPSNVLGVPGDLADATPTPTPAPGEKELPPEELTVDEVKVAVTLDLTTDVKTVDGEAVVEAVSADETVVARIPVAALTDTTTVEVTVNLIADADVENTVPTGTVVLAGHTLDIQVKDDQGAAITQFSEDISFTVKVDPITVDVETVAVFFFDAGLSVWIQIPATVSADGTVEWSVQHLTLFSLLRLSKVTVQLNTGLNLITFTGATGTEASAVAEKLGGASVIQNLLRFDASTQDFVSYVPNAPAIANTLKQLSQRDALFVNVTSPGPVLYTSTDIVVSESGSRTVTIVPGLNPISFTGTSGSDVGAFLAPLGSSVVSASRYNSSTQAWETFVPSAPAIANSLKTLNRLDVIFINVSGATQPFEVAEVQP